MSHIQSTKEAQGRNHVGDYYEAGIEGYRVERSGAPKHFGRTHRLASAVPPKGNRPQT